MPVLKLAKRSVDGLKPTDRAFIAFDTELRGFGVRVMPTGSKTFVFEYRPNGGGRAVAKRRLKLGRYGPLTVDGAREKAKHAHARVELGADPAAEKIEQRAALTVGQLIDAFIAEHVEPKCKAGTAEAHKVALARLRAPHGRIKAESLTRAQVATLHAALRASPVCGEPLPVGCLETVQLVGGKGAHVGDAQSRYPYRALQGAPPRTVSHDRRYGALGRSDATGRDGRSVVGD